MFHNFSEREAILKALSLNLRGKSSANLLGIVLADFGVSERFVALNEMKDFLGILDLDRGDFFTLKVVQTSDMTETNMLTLAVKENSFEKRMNVN